MPEFTRDGITFHYQDTKEGMPFVFQHGLGGDVTQPLSLYHPKPGIRLIAFDMRGHGQTYPLGNVEKLSMATLAGDLVALLDFLQIDQAVVGGISLGSAVAASVALRFPARVRALVLSRPAWIEGPVPQNVRTYALIARLIRQWGAAGPRTVPVHGRISGNGACVARLRSRSAASSNNPAPRNLWPASSDWPATRRSRAAKIIARSEHRH